MDLNLFNSNKNELNATNKNSNSKIDNVSYSVFHALNHATYNMNNSLDKGNSNLKNTFVKGFLQELNDYMYKQTNIARLKQLPKDSIFRITEDNDKYFIVHIDAKKHNLPESPCKHSTNDIYYIPKDMCDLNIDKSLYKIENYEIEETSYNNYLQLHDSKYRVVDELGNILK